MRCTKVRRKLMAYHDGELDAAVRGKIDRHLQTCPGCSRILESIGKADLAAGRAGVPDPGDRYWTSFTDRVMERVGAESRTDTSGSRVIPGRTGFSPVKLAPALSIALVVVVAAGVLMKVRRPAGPAFPLTAGETAAEGETSTEMTDRLGEGHEGNVTYYPPSPPNEEAATEGEETGTDSKGKPDRQEISRVTPARDALPEKKKAEGSSWPAENVVSLEPGIRDMDEPLEEEPSHAPEERRVKSILTPSAHEARQEAMVLPEVSERASAPRAIDDGSWGQLAFARELEEDGKHSESEKVLDDLLKRNNEPPVREEASLLLISVLANQNRFPEARQVLEGAQQRYPGNMMIQNYRFEGE